MRTWTLGVCGKMHLLCFINMMALRKPYYLYFPIWKGDYNVDGKGNQEGQCITAELVEGREVCVWSR